MSTDTKPVVTLFEAISVNGMITRTDGDASPFSASLKSFVDLAQAAGAVVWGRTTHEGVRVSEFAKEIPGVHRFVLTSNRELKVESGWKVVTTPEEAVESAAEAGAKELIVAGGGIVNTSFAKAGLLDRVVLDVYAIAYGEGLSLFAPGRFNLDLQLREIKYPTPTIVQLHYDVRRT